MYCKASIGPIRLVFFDNAHRQLFTVGEKQLGRRASQIVIEAIDDGDIEVI